MPSLVASGARRWPTTTALKTESMEITYPQLHGRSLRVAAGLSAAGLGPGDRLAVSARNGIDIVVAFLAAMRLGVVWVGINRGLAGPEKLEILADCGARVLLGSEAVLAEIEPLTNAVTRAAIALASGRLDEPGLTQRTIRR